MRIVLGVGVLLVAAMVSAQEIPTKSDKESQISALIADLGHKSFSVRERATECLQALLPLVKPQLEQAAANGPLEVRYRARWLLSDISEHLLRLRLKAFKNGEPGPDLPGWGECSKIWGNFPESRRLYRQMFKTHPKLLEAYATDPPKAAALLEHVCQKAKMERQQLSPVSMAALLLVSGGKRIQVPSSTFGQIRVVLRASHLAELLARGNEKFLGPLLSRWIDRPCDVTDRATTDAKLVLAIEYNRKPKALSLAIDFHRRLQQEKPADPEWAEQQAYFIHTIGRFGNETHIPLLEPSLADERTMSKGVQVRDVALISLVHLSGQHPQLYGFRFGFPEENWSGIAWNRFQLKDHSSRDQGVVKWSTWVKKKFKPDQTSAAEPRALMTSTRSR